MLKKAFVFMGVAIILANSIMLSSCGRAPEKNKNGDLSGNISISGAFALYPLVAKWAEEFQKLHPDVHIDLSAGGAGKGMTDVLADVVDLGMVSRDVYPPELKKGAKPFPTAKDAVVITFNANNPFASELKAKGISREIAKKIWITGEYTTWGEILGTSDKTPVHVYTRSDACGAAETFAAWMGKKQEDLLGTAVYADPGLASAIQADKLGVGLNNICYAYDEKSRKPNPGLLICPIDTDNDRQISEEEYFYDNKDEFVQAVSENKYPSPPARDLYLVTHGTPTNPVLVAFLEYVLTEGQQYNMQTGYIAIPAEKTNKALKKLHRKH